MTLHLIIGAQVKDEDAYQALAKEMPTHVERNEPGTLDYRWWHEDGGAHATFIDHDASPEAFAAHFQAMQDAGFVDRLMACCDIQSVHASGDTDATCDAILQQLGASRFHQVAGFTRHTAT